MSFRDAGQHRRTKETKRRKRGTQSRVEASNAVSQLIAEEAVAMTGITDEDVLRELGWHQVALMHWRWPNLNGMDVPQHVALSDPRTALAALEYMGKHSDWFFCPAELCWAEDTGVDGLLTRVAEGATHTKALINGVRAIMEERGEYD